MFGTMMSRMMTLITGVMVSAALLTGDASAQQPGGTSVALIDYIKIQRDAKASTDANRQARAFTATLEEEKKREDAKAQEENKALVGQRAILSPEAFAEKNAAFKKRLAAYNQKILANRRAIEFSYARAIKSIQEAAMEIAKGIAAKRGIDVVLYRNSAFLVLDDTLDITEEVMTKLDQTMPTVQLQLPDGGKQ